MLSQDDYLKLAKSLISDSGFEIRQIDWLAFTHNAVFDIWTSDNLHLVMRLQHLHDKDFSLLRAEFIWLIYLNNQHVKTLVPLAAFASDEHPYIGFTCHYIGGESPNSETVTVSEMHAMGVYLARLHQVAEQFEIPSDFQRPRLDWEGLFGDTGIYYPNAENMRVFMPEQLSIMSAVAERVRLAMDELGQGKSEFGIIHGDFLLKNILIHEADVYALDWEFFGHGYYLYDLTPLLWQLKPQARYEDLKTAFLAGYESLRPLTIQHKNLLETFIAGRQVASLRWIAANQQNPYVVGKVEQILAQRSAELADFLETGQLNRI